jgi:hypothetical protein
MVGGKYSAGQKNLVEGVLLALLQAIFPDSRQLRIQEWGEGKFTKKFQYFLLRDFVPKHAMISTIKPIR